SQPVAKLPADAGAPQSPPNPGSSQPTAPSMITQQSSQPPSQQTTSTPPTARKVDEIAATQKPAPATSPTTTEPTSRQLQQLPPAQTQQTAPSTSTTSSTMPAVDAASQTDQVKALPVSAKRWALVIGVDKYIDPQIS